MTESNLKQALSESPPGCQPLDLLVAFALEETGAIEQEREAIRAHVELCAACAHEVEMARALASPAMDAASDLDRNAVAQLKARLGEAPRFMEETGVGTPADQSLETDGASLLSFPRRFLPALQLAAAALLVTIGVVLWFDPAPELPDPGERVTRGSGVAVIGPVGSVAQPPEAFEWRRNEEAESYRVTLRDVRGTVLFECLDDVVVSSDGATASCAIPISVALQPYVRYSWQVSGLRGAATDDLALEIARSQWVSFTVVPDQP